MGKTFYEYITMKLLEAHHTGVVELKDAESYLHEWRIPKQLRKKIIGEMIQCRYLTYIEKKRGRKCILEIRQDRIPKALIEIF